MPEEVTLEQDDSSPELRFATTAEILNELEARNKYGVIVLVSNERNAKVGVDDNSGDKTTEYYFGNTPTCLGLLLIMREAILVSTLQQRFETLIDAARADAIDIDEEAPDDED